MSIAIAPYSSSFWLPTNSADNVHRRLYAVHMLHIWYFSKQASGIIGNASIYDNSMMMMVIIYCATV